MSRQLVVIYGDPDRQRVIQWARTSQDGTRFELKGPKRSLPQNDKMWAMLTDISEQTLHADGMPRAPERWRLIFLDALGHETPKELSLDGRSYFETTRSSSDLTRPEMSDLIELMYAVGAERGVQWSDPKEKSLMAAFDYRMAA